MLGTLSTAERNKLRGTVWPPPRLPTWVGHLAVAWWWTHGHGRKRGPCEQPVGPDPAEPLPGTARSRYPARHAGPFSRAPHVRSRTFTVGNAFLKSDLPVSHNSFSEGRAGVWKPVCFCLRRCHKKPGNSQALPRLVGRQHAGVCSCAPGTRRAPRDATLPVWALQALPVPLWAVARAARGG